MEQLGSELRYVCTINEANMGVQVAAIARRYMQQIMAKKQSGQAGGDKTDGTVQMGLNLEKMMANQQAAEKERMEISALPKPSALPVPALPTEMRLLWKLTKLPEL